MVSDAVLGALAGGGAGVMGAGITAIFSWLTTNRRIEADNKRAKAEYFWEKEAEVLTELHAKLEQCHREILSHWDVHEDNQTIPKHTHKSQISPAIEEYRIAIRKNGVFLPEHRLQVLNQALGQFYRSTDSIEWEPPSENEQFKFKEIDEMTSKYSEAKEALADQISKSRGEKSG